MNSLSLRLVQKSPVRSHDYWISDGVFYSMRIHYFYELTNRTLIEIFGAIADLDPEEKSAVLEAVGDWEKTGDTDSGL